MNNDLIEQFINMKISQIESELKVANRYWKADLKGQLSAYQDMKEFLNGVKDIKCNIKESSGLFGTDIKVLVDCFPMENI